MCNKLALLWKKYFDDYLICIDTSNNQIDNSVFGSYEDFNKKEKSQYYFVHVNTEKDRI